ncbi:MAG: folylpolyglutamate synthase/dihydrofolate synthase family protein [Candidatus Eisenbacteria bacterium]
MSVSLQHALEALYGLERRRDKHDLDGTIALLRALGDPHRRFRSVHVAGTNGKGSVCALIERVLREAGHRTGLFTSPHLVDFRERIRVDGRWADEAWLERRLEHIERLPEGKDRTFFEVCTALAFDYFAEQGVEIAVVEVGLGGRLDCTNVITPEVSVITSIGLDHTEILGETIEKIAFEKAGIIKPGVPVVTGMPDSPAFRVIERRAREVGAPLRRAEWTGDREQGTGPNTLTALEALAALAARGVAIPAAAVRRGMAEARWPGRFEACPGQPRLRWDGAHNPDGIRFLASQWAATRDTPPAAVVLALSRDKDVAAVLRALKEAFPATRLIATRTRSERAVDPARIAEVAAAAGLRATTAPDVAIACRIALADAPEGPPVLLTGSLFAVGEAMEALGGAPGEML